MKFHRSRLPKGNLFNYVDRKKKPLGKAAKKQVSRIANSAASRIVEKCHAMTFITPIVVPLTMTIGTNCIDLTALSATIAGSAYQKPRTGVRIKNHQLRINLNLNENPAATNFNVRVLVFKWHSTTATYNPTDALILAVPNSISAGNSVNSYPAYNAETQYSMLYDRCYRLLPSTTLKDIHVYINLYGKNLSKFSNFDNPTTNNGSNHIFLWVVADENTSKATFDFNCEYVYSDA